jgi:hypothetical protein
MESTGMDMRSAKNIIALIIGILVAYVIAELISGIVVLLLRLTGAIAMVVSIVFFAAIFFAMLNLLQKYAHIVFFGFDRE